MENQTIVRLQSLLDYVLHLGKLNEKPVYRLDKYKHLNAWEHQLSKFVGVHFHQVDEDGEPVWLRIDRMARELPPAPPDSLKPWIVLSNDPLSKPTVHKALRLPHKPQQLELAVEAGNLSGSVPVTELDARIENDELVIELVQFPAFNKKINKFLREKWQVWSQQEAIRRRTIKLYESLFNLLQTIEVQGDDLPIELIMGVGIQRWIYEGHKIDLPVLEQPVEMEFDKKDGALIVRPRKVLPTPVLHPYEVGRHAGVSGLLDAVNQHWDSLLESSDIEFSPFDYRSFEPVLRQAATLLSESGIYWPDINPDPSNREPPPASSTLYVTDSWCLFARPRRVTSFVDDIKRFQAKLATYKNRLPPKPITALVSDLSDRTPSLAGARYSQGRENSRTHLVQNKSLEVYFPKPYNDAQLKILECLEKSDGTVVQGPPGTGKTHTIANIICHYLATGRRVLVTSKSESALLALRDQIPERLRPLTISLLSNEKKGLKQLEQAINWLAELVSNTQFQDLNVEADETQRRLKSLNRDLLDLDEKIQELGHMHLASVPDDLAANPNLKMSVLGLATLLAEEGDAQHRWLPALADDALNQPESFDDKDIEQARFIRVMLGNDLMYLGHDLPQAHDLPDEEMLASWHEAIVDWQRIENLCLSGDVKLLENKSLDLLTPLAVSLSQLSDHCCTLEAMPWLSMVYQSLWSFDESAQVDGTEAESAALYDLEQKRLELLKPLLDEMEALVARRQDFVSQPVFVPDVGVNADEINSIVERLLLGKRPFSLPFGHSGIKQFMAQIQVHGEQPNSPEEWLLVKNYMSFQHDVERFVTRWNHIGLELDLPPLRHKYGELFRDAAELYQQIHEIKCFIEEDWPSTYQSAKQVFPESLAIEQLPHSGDLLRDALNQVAVTIQSVQIKQQLEKFNQVKSELKSFYLSTRLPVLKQLSQCIDGFYEGRDHKKLEQILEQWRLGLEDLERLHTLQIHMDALQDIAERVANDGADAWSHALLTQSCTSDVDPLTPVSWRESWLYVRRKCYLSYIDSHESLMSLIKWRKTLDDEQKRVFLELVRLKTSMGLHKNMTELVQSALMRFVAALSKLGKGAGIRAPRHRREAYQAMQDCYSGVPCWVMPSWRISETLPSELASFDLVIIDEASQSDISVLPAILRAKKLLIVGDDKQVSPTAAFLSEEKMQQLTSRFLQSQPFSELLLPGVSIYELAKAAFPGQRVMLTEHFRCVEPIIRFSMQFYSEQLIPLRLPTPSERLDPPLVDVFLPDGKRDEVKKINTVEIDAIAEEVKKIVSDKSLYGRTIGVISLIGNKQALAIQERLLRELGEDVYQRWQITCGDSATFQGKERDIVLLSMVVGSGQGGSLTKRDAEQRFNVALSRARDRVYLFRSIDEQDLANDMDLRFQVLQHFSKPQINVDMEGVNRCETEIERQLFGYLQSRGYKVKARVPVGYQVITLIVEGDLNQRLAICIDGEQHQSLSAWTESLRYQSIMERVGWTFWRCWASSYLYNNSQCLQNLEEALRALNIYPQVKDSHERLVLLHSQA